MKHRGFTLIELMIVIAIIAIIAAIAIPNLLESRIAANESAAAATLKSGIFPGEVQFQSGAYSDFDTNGRGEYAKDIKYLAGSTAAAATGTTTKILSFIAPSFSIGDGVAVGSYAYQLDVCTCAGTTNGDQVMGESFFAGYAAPGNPGSDGRRSFGINSFGSVMSTKQSLLSTPAIIGLSAVAYSGGFATAVANAPPAVTLGTAGVSAIFASDPISSNASINTNKAAPFLK